MREFKMPTQPSITDIRSWYGFVNQVAPLLATAPIMEPFRELIKHPAGKKIYWDAQLEEKIRMAKDTICQLAKNRLAYFERLLTCLWLSFGSEDDFSFTRLFPSMKSIQ